MADLLLDGTTVTVTSPAPAITVAPPSTPLITMAPPAGTSVTVTTPAPSLTMAPPAASNVVVLPVAGAPGRDGEGGDGQALAALSAHIASPTPHPAYDVDLQSLTILLENGLA